MENSFNHTEMGFVLDGQERGGQRGKMRQLPHPRVLGGNQDAADEGMFGGTAVAVDNRNGAADGGKWCREKSAVWKF